MLYTGGPRPYGYEGLGEVFVFLFFGIVAVTGSYYVQTEEVSWEAFAFAVPVGLLASAILVVNNVRDLETDRRAGKRTLAVRLGRTRTRTVYGVMVYGAFLTAPLPWRSPRRPAARPRGRRGCCCRSSCCPSPSGSSASCAPTPTGRRSTSRSPAPGCSSSASASCSRPRCC